MLIAENGRVGQGWPSQVLGALSFGIRVQQTFPWLVQTEYFLPAFVWNRGRLGQSIRFRKPYETFAGLLFMRF